MLASTLSVSAFAADAPAADAAQSQIVEPVKTTGEGDEIPGEGDVIPGEGDVIPGEGDETPGEGDETPGEGDEIPGEGDETPGEGDETPGEVDETPGEGDGFVLPEGYTEADLALLEADPATLSFANQLKQQELSDALNEAMGISVMSFGAPEYTIATAQDLKDFADSVNNNGNGYYNTTIKLTADIDLSSVCSATAGSWTPIGTLSNKFMGTFDGQNHTISNLYINGNVPVAGLFGYCAGSIKNLGVVNASITTSATSARVGVIVGDLSHISAYPAIIMENCYSTGTVQATANGAYAAGIAGYLYEATLKNCYSTVAVTAPSQSYAGGVIGRLSDSTLENCYSTGVVSGSTELGSYAGGIVAFAADTFYLTNCVALNPSVAGGQDTWSDKSYTGAVAGFYNTSGGTDEGCGYWSNMTVTKSGTELTDTDKDTIGATALTYDAGAAKLKAGSDDFAWTAFPDANWENKTAGTQPTLKNLPGQSSALPNHIKGTTDELLISTADELKAFAAAVNGGDTFEGKTIKLTADIDLSSVCSATAGSWTPIGTDDTNRFDGTFDGQNHTVSNLYINSADAFNVGLFGYCCGTVKNLGVVNASVNTSRNGNVWVGIIAGQLTSFTADSDSSNDTAHLNNCFATGTVTVAATDSKYVGGLVGNAIQSTISNCYSTAAVTVTATTGQANVGGVVGLLEDATLDACYCTGAVSGSTVLGSTTGGVVAWARKANVTSSVTNCVALNPSVSGANNSLSKVQTGAVVGYCFNANNATLTGNAYWDGMTIKKNGTTVTDKDQSSSTALTYNATEAKLKAGSDDFVWTAFPDENWENKTAGTVPTLKTIPGQSSLLPAHIKPRVAVTITDLDLTGLLAAPVKNNAPQTTVTDTQYTGTVTWSPNVTSFAGDTVYTATVTLTAAEGYKLEGLAANAFTYTGATGVSNDADSGVVSIVFPATPARTLTSIAVKTAPTKKDYTYGDAFAPAGLELTLTYDDGTDTVVYSDANAADFTFSAMPAGTTAVTVTYGGQTASISGITVAKKALSWDVSGLSAIKPEDGTTAAKVTGTLKVSGVVGEDDAEFSYASLSGTYGVSDSGTDRMVTVTVTDAVLGNDNYSLPTTKPTFLGTIARPVTVTSIPADSTTLKLTVTDILVPAALKMDDALNTPEKITAAMQQKAAQLLPGVPDEQIFTTDIALWQKNADQNWEQAEQVASYTQGVTITEPYAAFGLTADSAKGIDFVIAHMISSGDTAGTIESLPYTLTADGLQFTMYSFSPVTIAFRAKSAAPAPTVTTSPATAAAPGKYTVNAWVNVLAGGVISPMGITSYAEGENVTYTITPAKGYRVAKVLVDGVDVGAVGSYTFSGLNRSHEIGVYFDKGASTAQAIGAPKTGDNAPITLWCVLLFSAILGLSSMERMRRKNNQ